MASQHAADLRDEIGLTTTRTAQISMSRLAIEAQVMADAISTLGQE